jgi:hypothetical protein
LPDAAADTVGAGWGVFPLSSLFVGVGCLGRIAHPSCSRGMLGFPAREPR